MYDNESNCGKSKDYYGRNKLANRDDDFIRNTDDGYDRGTRVGWGGNHQASMDSIMAAYNDYRESKQW